MYTLIYIATKSIQLFEYYFQPTATFLPPHDRWLLHPLCVRWPTAPQQTKANLDKFADQVQATLPKDSAVNLTTQGCMPLTVLVKVKMINSTRYLVLISVTHDQPIVHEQTKRSRTMIGRRSTASKKDPMYASMEGSIQARQLQLFCK